VAKRREAKRQREAEQERAAAVQKGYDELKIMFFGLAVGVALMWSARW
jgi:hypothetical protein